MSQGEEQMGREKESQADSPLGGKPSVGSWAHKPEIITSVEAKSQPLNQLRHLSVFGINTLEGSF